MIGGRVTPTSIRTHADQVQHPCRPTSAPVLNRFYLFYISFFSSSIYLWGTPRGPVPLFDRSLQVVRDFRPLIPSYGGRRLHGHLGGRSGFLSPQKRRQPRGFSSLSRHQSASNLGGRPSTHSPRRFHAPMPTATTTEPTTGQHTTSRSTTQPTNTNTPTTQLERSAAQRLRTTTAA